MMHLDYFRIVCVSGQSSSHPLGEREHKVHARREIRGLHHRNHLGCGYYGILVGRRKFGRAEHPPRARGSDRLRVRSDRTRVGKVDDDADGRSQRVDIRKPVMTRRVDTVDSADESCPRSEHLPGNNLSHSSGNPGDSDTLSHAADFEARPPSRPDRG